MVLDWVTFGEPLSFWQMLLRIVAAVIFGAIIGIERLPVAAYETQQYSTSRWCCFSLHF